MSKVMKLLNKQDMTKVNVEGLKEVYANADDKSIQWLMCLAYALGYAEAKEELKAQDKPLVVSSKKLLQLARKSNMTVEELAKYLTVRN